MGLINKVVLSENSGDTPVASGQVIRRNASTSHDVVEAMHDDTARGSGLRAATNGGVKPVPLRGVHDEGLRGKGVQIVHNVGGRTAARRGEKEVGNPDTGEHDTVACGDQSDGGKKEP